MSISSVSPSVAPSIVHSAPTKTQASTAQQTNKPVAPAAVKPVADSDGDHDGSGGINVKA
jgi:hypothetical protein